MKELLKNKIVRLSIIYALVQTLYCIIASACDIFPIISLVVAIILLVGYLVALFLTYPKKQDVQTEPQPQQQVKIDNTLTYKIISNSLCELVDLCNDDAVKAELKTLADDFRYADPVSNTETCDIEDQIVELIEQIKARCADDDIQVVDLTNKLRAAIGVRNRLCKDNK